MPVTGIAPIPSGKEITIQSDTTDNWTLIQTNSLARHFLVNGSLILNNITIDGGNVGGGVDIGSSGIFTMNNGVIIENCYTSTQLGASITNHPLKNLMNYAFLFLCRRKRFYFRMPS